MNTEDVVIEKLRSLPLEKQREVLDFVEFLQAKASSPSSQSPKSAQAFTELREALFGSVDGGSGDLATNSEHMKDYGKR